MNPFNPQKLLHSKWTAVTPQSREKHFIVTELLRDEAEKVIACRLEAVLTHRESVIDWRLLKDAAQWQQGWR
jgi:tryptophan-rich hypothetical protein